MSIAYWCVLVAALLPYVWSCVAKAIGARAGRLDNHNPRGWLARQADSRVQRANAAQYNSFEAFAPFAAGVVLAQLAGVDGDRIATLAVTFVVLRFVYGLLYLGDRPTLRSLVWFAGLVCVVALLAQAALAIGAPPNATLAPA